MGCGGSSGGGSRRGWTPSLASGCRSPSGTWQERAASPCARRCLTGTAACSSSDPFVPAVAQAPSLSFIAVDYPFRSLQEASRCLLHLLTSAHLNIAAHSGNLMWRGLRPQGMLSFLLKRRWEPLSVRGCWRAAGWQPERAAPRLPGVQGRSPVTPQGMEVLRRPLCCSTGRDVSLSQPLGHKGGTWGEARRSGCRHSISGLSNLPPLCLAAAPPAGSLCAEREGKKSSSPISAFHAIAAGCSLGCPATEERWFYSRGRGSVISIHCFISAVTTSGCSYL